MEPGCFSSCFMGDSTTTTNDLGTSRTTRKMMLTIVGVKNKKFNPEEVVYNVQEETFKTEKNVKKRHVFTEFDSLKGQNYSEITQKIGIHRIQSGRKSKYYLKHQSSRKNISSLGSHQSSIMHSEQKYQKSLLYGGAKNIISKMSSVQRKKHKFSPFTPVQYLTQDNTKEYNLSTVKYTNYITQSPSCKLATLDQTQNDCGLFQSITYPKMLRNPSFSNSFQFLKLGKLLGRGKYCHVYLCQDAATNCIFVLKQIFKETGLLPPIYSSIIHNILFLIRMNNPSLISCYKSIQDNEKISIIQQFSPSLLYHQINQYGTLSIDLVKKNLKQIIQAIVILHQNNKAHGNLNPVQIGYFLGTCKVRISLTQLSFFQPQFLKDIHAIGLIGYEMAYGLTKIINKHNPLRDELKYYDVAVLREKVIGQLSIKKGKKDNYSSLNSFLIWMLEKNANMRICGSSTLTHQFFRN